MVNQITKWYDPGSVVVSDDMIDHDFDNDPVFKAKFERAKEFIRKHPLPFTNNKRVKKSNKKSKKKSKH